MRLQVNVPKTGTIRMLKEKVAEITSIDADAMLCTDVWMHRIHTLREDNGRVSQIQVRADTRHALSAEALCSTHLFGL